MSNQVGARRWLEMALREVDLHTRLGKVIYFQMGGTKEEIEDHLPVMAGLMTTGQSVA